VRVGPPAQPDEPTPVLTEEHDLPQVELVEQGLCEPVDVPGVGVILHPGRLVGSAEPDQVRGDHAAAVGDQGWQHVAVEVAPGRLAVQQQHDRAGQVALAQVVETDRVAAIGIGDLEVVGGEGVARKVGERRVGGASELHRGVLGSRASGCGAAV
jgi:hypothetical protein